MPRLIAHAVLAALVLAGPAAAASRDPAGTVAELQAGLTAAARAGGLAARTTALLPVVRATHDMATMTRLVAGPGWSAATPGDQAKLVEAFTRHSTLAYATNFASIGGEHFVVDPKVETRGSDALVRSTIGGTALNYRLQQGDGGWRIVDAYADGISQLAIQRAEFAATMKAGGVAALAAKLVAADEAKSKR